MGEWKDGAWAWKLTWRRQLLQRELEKVNDLLRLIACFSPSVNRSDQWCWTKEGSGIYTVNSAYRFIQGKSDLLGNDSGVFSKLWAAKVPSNAVALSWRVLNSRIPTMTELLRRNALPAGTSPTCSLCADDEESISHLFLHCNVGWRIWMKVYNWLGLSTVLCDSVDHHFLQHDVPGVRGKGRKAVSSIWIATIRAIWNLRNGVIFRGESVDIERVLDGIQFRVWIWIKAYDTSFGVSFFEWIGNPRVCLEML